MGKVSGGLAPLQKNRYGQGLKVEDIPVLSFFTGAGFLDMGFIQAGFDIVWHNEYDSSFVKGFECGMPCIEKKEHGHTIQNKRSIIEVGPNEIAKEAFSNTQRPEVFGVIGGPPCPDFSVGGKNKGREGERGQLSQVYVNRIIELQPTFFLFENVPGLLRTSKHRVFLNHLINQLTIDYSVDLRILNALEYGVPQDRERVFLVGIQKKWLRKNKLIKKTMPRQWFPWPESIYPDAKAIYKWPGVSPFGQVPEKPEGIPDELMVGSYICSTGELEKLKNGMEGLSPKSDKIISIPEGDVSRKSFKRLHRWRYSPTVAYGHNEVHLHPAQPRRLTVREALRIQTVPDEYFLPEDMSLTDKFKTIGNGVPVKLAYNMACSFIKLLGSGINEF